MEVFVPGRLCLLGEHTDWAAGKHKLVNPAIPTGYCIVCATNEGLFARVQDFPAGQLRYEHRDAETGEVLQSIEFALGDAAALGVEAGKSSFFSYVYGVAAHLMSLPVVAAAVISSQRGIFINNHTTTLPMKKGLSSSAAICTVVVQAFSKHYGLRLSRDEVMDCAFHGEILTGAKCGRMDQAVAMGEGKVGLMVFNGDSCELRELHVGRPLHFVVVDLKRGKDTVKILAELNAAFPSPQTPEHHLLHQYVASNVDLSAEAVRAISVGDCAALATCMKAAQAEFDRCAIPNCPSELTSPRLHQVMAHAALARVSLAVKGVGSQGDGSAQVLCADEESQREALRVLQDELVCEGFLLTVPASQPEQE